MAGYAANSGYAAYAGRGRHNVAAATAATTSFTALAASVNVTGKYEGRQVFNVTTNKPVYAAGAAAADVWVDATGATVHTPA